MLGSFFFTDSIFTKLEQIFVKSLCSTHKQSIFTIQPFRVSWSSSESLRRGTVISIYSWIPFTSTNISGPINVPFCSDESGRVLCRVIRGFPNTWGTV